MAYRNKRTFEHHCSVLCIFHTSCECLRYAYKSTSLTSHSCATRRLDDLLFESRLYPSCSIESMGKVESSRLVPIPGAFNRMCPILDTDVAPFGSGHLI